MILLRLTTYFKLLPAFLLTGLVVFSSCKDPITEPKKTNLPPTTTLFIDATDTNNAFNSQLTLYWDGNDPDGEIVGFLVSLDSAATWKFTKNRQETVVVPTQGKSQLVTRIFVSAVDNGGDGIHNSQVMYLGKNIGPESFTDVNNNGIYDSGEPFIDYGLIDPNPANVLLKVKNAIPTSNFNPNFSLPTASLPAMTVLLIPNDPDGLGTLAYAEIALNDTTIANAWTQFPATTTVLTMIADFTDTLSMTQSAKLYSGNNLIDLHVSVSNMQMGQPNKIYYRVVDNTGAVSVATTLPVNGGPSWTVNKPTSAGELLIVRDHSFANGDSLRSVLRRVKKANGVDTYQHSDFITLKNSGGAEILSKGIAQNVMRATARQYKKVIWYGLNTTNLGLAQQVIPNYLQTGGKILFRTGFNSSLVGPDLDLSFLPIDSLNTKYYKEDGTNPPPLISTWRTGAKIIRDQAKETFPQAKPDTNFHKTLPELLQGPFVSDARVAYYSIVPSPRAFVLYRLDTPRPANLENWPVNPAVYKGTGTPVVMIENEERNLVFTTIPLTILTQKPGDGSYPKTVGSLTFSDPLVELLYRILSEEFER